MKIKEGMVYKKKIVKDMSELTKLSQEECSLAYEGFVKAIKLRILNGEGVQLKGLGSFMFVPHRSGKSNLTGQYWPKHYRIKFRMAQLLANYIARVTREI